MTGSVWRGAALALLVAGRTAAPAGAGERAAWHTVERAAVVAAMQGETGYDVAKTTNAPRFQAAVLLRLARGARASDPDGPPLRIGHDEWFQAYLARLGVPAEAAPEFARLAWRHGQDTLLEYRPDHVLAPGQQGPGLAVSVVSWFPASGPDEFSYEDRLSVPELEVTIERVVRYRLLEWPDRIAYEDVEGLRGRPASGLLGMLFKLIGKGHVEYSRLAVSSDGLQVAFARAVKGPFGVSTTVTVRPDGTAEKDVPSGREDLQAIEGRLREPVHLEYRDYPAVPDS